MVSNTAISNIFLPILTTIDAFLHVSLIISLECLLCVALCHYRTFATGIFNKLAEMIQGLVTPVDMKIKLIPVFQHMHHDANTTVKVKSEIFCEISIHLLNLLQKLKR